MAMTLEQLEAEQRRIADEIKAYREAHSADTVEYPLIMRNLISGNIAKFTSRLSYQYLTGPSAGALYTYPGGGKGHMDSTKWEPWTLDKPQWCKVRAYDKQTPSCGLVVRKNTTHFEDIQGIKWVYAEPCNPPVFSCDGKKWRIIAEKVDI